MTAGFHRRLPLWALARYAMLLLIVSTLSLSIGSIFPTQYVLDTATFRYSAAQAVAPSPDGVAGIRDLDRALGPSRQAYFITSAWGELKHGDRSIDHVNLYVYTSGQQDLTYFPPQTLVKASSTRDGQWVDISIDAASALGVRAGDVVSYPIAADALDLVVRDIYAARDGNSRAVAQVNLSALPRDELTENFAPAEVWTTASSEQVRAAVESAPLSGIYEDLGYEHVADDVRSISELRDQVGEQSIANLGIVLALSMVAGLTMLGLVIRESLLLVRRTADERETLWTLGVPRRVLENELLIAAGLVLLIAVGLGATIGRVPYLLGIFGPGLVPELRPGWWVAVGAAVVAGVATVMLALGRGRTR